MKNWDKNRLEVAREKLLKQLPIEIIRQIPKYKEISKEQYFLLISRLEELGLMLLKSYIFNKKDTS